MICILSNLTRSIKARIPQEVTIFVIFWNLHFSARLQRLEIGQNKEMKPMTAWPRPSYPMRLEKPQVKPNYYEAMEIGAGFS